jgi:ribonuclease HI
MKRIYADATDKAIAIYDNGFELTMPATSSNIVLNELSAILAAVKYANNFTSETFCIYSDNKVACTLIQKGYSNVPVLDEVVNEINYEFYSREIKAKRILVKWIPGSQNKADKASRRKF